jgi:hypothetical protein
MQVMEAAIAAVEVAGRVMAREDHPEDQQGIRGGLEDEDAHALNTLDMSFVIGVSSHLMCPFRHSPPSLIRPLRLHAF